MPCLLLCPPALVDSGKRLEDEEIQLLERFSLAYIRTELPSWFYKVWLTLQTMALLKTAERTEVRPLGLRNSLVKVIHREVMAQSKMEIRDYLEPVQLGQSVAGAAKLVFSVGGALRSDPNLACCRIDLRSAFNECSKTAILKVLVSVDTLAHLTSFTANILAPTVALESGGRGGVRLRMGWCRGTSPVAPSSAWPCIHPCPGLTRSASREGAWLGLASMTSSLWGGLRWCCRLSSGFRET